MGKRYFELAEDMSHPGRWLLGNPMDAQGQEVESRQFMRGESTQVEGHLRVPIYHPGTALDFSLVDDGGFPVVSRKVATVLSEVTPGDVQLFPVEVESRPEPYFLLNVTCLVKCIDDEASAEVRYWKPEDGRPERVGQYRGVYGLRIDPTKVGDAKVFRTWGWRGTLIVAEDVKEALERTGVTGLKFEEVTGPSPIREEDRVRDRRCRELLQEANVARETAWRTFGRLDKSAVTPAAADSSWPGRRQLWRVIHREGGRTLLVTHGLSDPFIARMEPSVGFGLELAMEVDESLPSVEESWLFRLLERVAEEVARNENVREQVEAGLFSLDVSGEGLPGAFVTQEGRAAVLMGVESRTLPRHFATPFGDVRLVTVKALRPSERAFLLEHGAEGRVELARRFTESGEEYLSSARRSAVV